MPDSNQIPLTLWQADIISRLQTNTVTGLNTFEASTRRGDGKHEQLNLVSPPVDCPAWICCLLPCIKHIPSMKLYDSIIPEDADVLRDGEWICYDAASLVLGDVICLREGETVPADCVVVSLGDVKIPETDGNEELVVDSTHITGEIKPRTIISKDILRDDGMDTAQVYYGSHVLHGCALAVVNAVGNNTRLGTLIRESQWPKFAGTSKRTTEPTNGNDDLHGKDVDETTGSIALLSR